MKSIYSNASGAFWVRVFAALLGPVMLVAVSPRQVQAGTEHRGCDSDSNRSGVATADDTHHHTTFSFVTASASSNLFMIDRTTNKAVAQVPKDGPLQTVVSADGKATYSVDTNDSQVLLIDGDSDDPDRICVSGKPSGLALSLDGKKLFVFASATNANADTNTNTISVIDTSEEEVVEVDPAPAYHFGVHVTPDGHLTAVN